MKKEKNQEKSIKNFILESEFFAKKSLGQNFLIDQNIIKKIANFLSKSSCELSLEPSCTPKYSCELSYSNNPNNPKYIIEIGAGPGILTKEIAKQFPHSTIFAIEKDDRFIKNLETISNVHVIHKDALKCDWNEIAQQMIEVRNAETGEIETTFDAQINTTLDEQCNPQLDPRRNPKDNTQSNLETSTYKISTHSSKSYSFNQGNKENQHKQNQHIDKISVIGNLPYNVSVPILFSLLEKRHLFDQFIFMFQKEVANRITAKPNNSNYGKLSIMTQIHSVPSKILHVPPTVFWPQPKIDSEIVRFKIQNNFMHNIAQESKMMAGQNEKITPENEISVLENDEIVSQNDEIQNKEFHEELNKEIEKLTFIAFQQRRKTFQSIFRNALKNGHYNENEFKNYDMVNFSEECAANLADEGGVVNDSENKVNNKDDMNNDGNKDMNQTINQNMNQGKQNSSQDSIQRINSDASQSNANTLHHAQCNSHYYDLDTSSNKPPNKSVAFYEEIFIKLQLNIKNRPENFSPQEFCKIAMEILKLRN